MRRKRVLFLKALWRTGFEGTGRETGRINESDNVLLINTKGFGKNLESGKDNFLS